MIQYRKSKSVIEAFAAYDIIRHLEDSYPDFENWYVNKAIPDIVSKDGVLYIAEEHGKIIGISIGKKGDNPKLRCVRVIPEYQKKGIGIHLMDRTLKEIGDKPLVSVSEPMMHSFARTFVNYFDFNLSYVEKGLYKKNTLEYVFNGRLGVKSEY